MSTPEYTHKDIQELSAFEHIRLRPAMYIGETKHPNHLLYEVLDNSLDECHSGHATMIGVEIDNTNNIVTVADNGRGIPIDEDTIIKIATKMFSGGKFSKGESRAYGISCFPGYSKIQLVNGEVSIQEMAENPEKDYYTLSCSTDGKWLCEKAVSPQLTGYTQKLIRVHLDNGKFEDCTPEHLWMKRDGSYIAAKDLQPNDSMMPCYIRQDDRGYYRIRPNDTYEDYERNIQYSRRGWVALHRLVYESFNNKIPFGYAIHHIDMNPSNNIPSNLQCLHNQKEHLKIHVPHLVATGIINTKALVRYNLSEKGRENSRRNGLAKGKDNLLKYVKSDENRRDKKERMTAYNKIQDIQEDIRKKKLLKYIKTLIKNGMVIEQSTWDRFRPYGVCAYEKVNDIAELIIQSHDYSKYHPSLVERSGGREPMITARIFSIFQKIEEDSKEINIENFNIYRGKFDPSIKGICVHFGDFDSCVSNFRNRKPVNYNHRVVRIEEINLDSPIAVYDFCTPVNHNFVLACGAVVHNSGLHGIGLVAVTALTDYVSFTVYRDSKKAYYRFENGELKEKTIIDYVISETNKKPFSTQVQFKPSKKYFESLTFLVAPIRERLKLASLHVEKLQLLFIVDKKAEVINNTYSTYFQQTLLDNKSQDTTMIYKLQNKIKDEELEIVFCYQFRPPPNPKRQTGCVNLLSVDDGTHINLTWSVFKNVFEEISKKEKLNFEPEDSLVGLRVHTALFLYNPEYTSQTKEKLANRKAHLDSLYSNMEQALKTLLESNADLKNKLLSSFVEYRRRQNSSKVVVKTTGSVNRYNNSIDSNLRDCTSHDVASSELFITEGQSAAGSLIQCRDPLRHAILPLKGKIPNVAAESKEALKNDEIVEIINSLGTGIEPDFSGEGLRYGKIVISTDADADGSHIACLLMVMFLRLTPKLIESGNIYRAILPLYGTKHNNVFYPFYTEEEMSQFLQSHPNVKIQRYKGLGEMNPDELKICLLSERRKLERIPVPENIADIYNLMIDSELKRQLIQT